MDPTTCSTAGAPSAAPCGWRAGGPEGLVPTGLGRHPSLVAPLRVGLFELLVCSWRALGDLGRFPRFGFPWEGLVHASGRRPVGRVLREGEGGCLRPAGRTAAPRRGSCSGRRSGRPTGLWGGRDSGSPAGLSGLQGSAALCTGGAPRVPGESLLREDGAAPEAGVAAGRTRAPGPPPPERAGSPWGGADAGVWSHVPACPPAEGPLLPCRGPGRALAVTLGWKGQGSRERQGSLCGGKEGRSFADDVGACTENPRASAETPRTGGRLRRGGGVQGRPGRVPEFAVRRQRAAGTRSHEHRQSPEPPDRRR